MATNEQVLAALSRIAGPDGRPLTDFRRAFRPQYP